MELYMPVESYISICGDMEADVALGAILDSN